MANISFVFGSYMFNFENTKIKGDKTAQVAWLERLAKDLYCMDVDGEPFLLTYATYLDMDSLNQSDNEIYISFTGDGRWAYHNNISWFETEHADLLKELDGLQISIDYTDYEFGIMQIQPNGGALITVEGDKIKIVYDEKDWENLTPKAYLEYGCGEFCDMVGEFSLEYYDLTDEQLEKIAQMDASEFNEHWETDFKNM